MMKKYRYCVFSIYFLFLSIITKSKLLHTQETNDSDQIIQQCQKNEFYNQTISACQQCPSEAPIFINNQCQACNYTSYFDNQLKDCLPCLKGQYYDSALKICKCPLNNPYYNGI